MSYTELKKQALESFFSRMNDMQRKAVFKVKGSVLIIAGAGSGKHPESNIVAVDFDPGASEVNQVNRIKLMLTQAFERAGISRRDVITPNIKAEDKYSDLVAAGNKS